MANSQTCIACRYPRMYDTKEQLKSVAHSLLCPKHKSMKRGRKRGKAYG